MRVLLVYYSRTGRTAKVAKEIARKLDCRVEEIVDTTKRSGLVGMMRCGFQAFFKRPTVIQEVQEDPSQYDIVIIGTPIWAQSVSPPIRAYIQSNRNCLKRVAFFCTVFLVDMGWALGQMEKLCGQKPVSTLCLKQLGATEEGNRAKIDRFISQIK